ERRPHALLPFCQGGLWGYIDENARVVIPCRFAEAGPFLDGYAAARADTFFGYIDTTGRWVIRPQYDYGTAFSEGWAKVYWSETRTALINRQGKELVLPDSVLSEMPYRGYFLTEPRRGPVQLRDSTGRVVLQGTLNRLPTGDLEYLSPIPNKNPSADHTELRVRLLDYRGRPRFQSDVRGLRFVGQSGAYYLMRDTVGRLVCWQAGWDSLRTIDPKVARLVKPNWQISVVPAPASTFRFGLCNNRTVAYMYDLATRRLQRFENVESAYFDAEEARIYYHPPTVPTPPGEDVIVSYSSEPEKHTWTLEKTPETPRGSVRTRVELDNGGAILLRDNALVRVDPDGMEHLIFKSTSLHFVDGEVTDKVLVSCVALFDPLRKRTQAEDTSLHLGPRESLPTRYIAVRLRDGALLSLPLHSRDFYPMAPAYQFVSWKDSVGYLGPDLRWVFKGSRRAWEGDRPPSISYQAQMRYMVSDTAHRKEWGHGAPRGWVEPTPIPRHLTLPSDSVGIHISALQKDGQREICVYNTTASDQKILCMDGSLIMRYGAALDTGFAAVEFRPWTFCGNSYYNLILPKGYCWLIRKRMPEGPIKVPMQLRMGMGRRDMKLSNTVMGGYTPGQLWRQETLGSGGGIMNPYIFHKRNW
ncbi:WG repeat-containing protein, partial [Nostoc sp. NIES-2111]